MAKSIKKNAIYSLINTGSSLIFPLISFQYASRVLFAENIGKVNYSNSIVTYFTLFAALGIATYAVREGARIRDDRLALQNLASELFSINMVSTLISYIALILLAFFNDALHPYKYLLLIQGTVMFFNTLGVNWINTIYEDYAYITVRNVLMQIISFILMILFVHESRDYYLYALILVASSVGANIMNFFHTRSNYCKCQLIFKKGLLKHLKPICLIFAMSLSISIYVNVDITMLGIFEGDRSVGIYTASAKIYSMIKTILTAALTVTIPRFSYYLGEKKEKEYLNLAKNVSAFLLVFAIPVTVGLILLSKDVLWIYAGNDFLSGSMALRLLSIAIVISVFANMVTNAILIPLKKELLVWIATVLSALTNIILNLFFIPNYGMNGAAITTIISETLTLLTEILYLYWKKYLKSKYFFDLLPSLVKCCISSIGIVGVCIAANSIERFEIRIIIQVFASVIIYFLILLLLKESTVADYCTKTVQRIRGRKYEKKK